MKSIPSHCLYVKKSDKLVMFIKKLKRSALLLLSQFYS